MFQAADLVHETTTGTGTGSLALAGAVDNAQAFSAICSDGDTFFYGIRGQSGNQFETGYGHYVASGNMVSRDIVIESSNSNTFVSFAAGVKDIYITSPASQIMLARTFGFTTTAASGATATLNFAATLNQVVTLTANCTFTFDAPLIVGATVSVTLIQDATGSRTVTWPVSVKWGSAGAPTLSTGANDVDLITFLWNGSYYVGTSVVLATSAPP